MATKSNLVIDQGSDFNIDVILTDENEDPVNINNYELSSSFKKWYNSNTEILFTITPHPEFNLFSVSLTAEQTANIQSGRYVYDILLKEKNENEINRIVEGILTVSPEVTK